MAHKARKNIFRLKFHSRPDIAENFAKALILQLNEREILENTDIITFVPMRAFSKLKRGYNQSELLAERIAEILGKECVACLEKIKETGEHVMVRLIKPTILAYIRNSSIEDSIKAEGIEQIKLD